MASTSLEVKNYRRTIPGLLTLIYSNQKMTSKAYGRTPPTYSKDELRDWLLSQPHFKDVFDAWVASDYKKDLSPSIDRLDNTKGYSLTNIQLVTFRQNLLNQKRQNKDGTYLHAKSKAVQQWTKDGQFVVEYPSMQIALRAVGGASSSNIAAVANGVWKSAYGYDWRWPEAQDCTA